MDGVPTRAPDSAAPLPGAAAAAAPTTIVASHFPRDAAARLYATCADDRDDGVVAGLAARHGAFVAAAARGHARPVGALLGLLRVGKIFDPNAGGWVQPFIPRIVGLTILDRFGIHTFEYLPVLAFAVDPLSSANPTASYSYRLQQNYSAHADFSADIRNIRKPTRLLVGAEDDLLIADAFAPLFGAERSDIPIKIIPGLGHTEMSVMPEALSAFVEALGE